MIIIVLFAPVLCTASIGISPDHLDFTTDHSGVGSQKIFLQNLNETPITVRLDILDEKNRPYIKFSEQQLILHANAIEVVNIQVSKKKSFKSEVSITDITKSTEKLDITTGIKIPITVNYKNQNDHLGLLIGLLVLFSATGMTYLVARRKQQKT